MQDAPPKTAVYILGLGSNLGDRLATLRAAVKAIEHKDIHVLARSRVYLTAAVGPPQDPYLNAALRVAWHGRPTVLMTELLQVERDLGRVRPDPVRWGPRTIDIDVLWYGGGVIEAPDLIVPHPRLHERAFAVHPLLDVAPGATDPATGRAYADSDVAKAPREIVGGL